ncbi:PAS domain S-box protein [Pelagibius sp. 7325]|uniref:PAS domain-containing hybrid sensor histidine kinase/response regulator n=1 Tax=Pelagibius sp. 7325 TaxID=3131994 RepID=UPI0030ED2D5E
MLSLLTFVIGAALGGAAGAGALWYWQRRRPSLCQSVFAAVPKPWQVVSPAGRSILANPALESFFGGDERPIPELLLEQVKSDPEARRQIEQIDQQAQRGLLGQAEIRVPAAGPPGGGAGRRSGYDWRFVAAYPLPGYPGYVYWVVDDITPRRQMEQIMREEQERFVDLLENAPVGFYSADAEGRFLFANHTLCEWLGLAQNDLELGRVRLHDVVANVPAGTPSYDPFGLPGASQGEVLLKDADGETFRASIRQDVVTGEDDRVLRTRSVVRDLSREMAMAAALEESEHRFEQLFAKAPAGIALIDPKGAIQECNDALGRLIGRERQALRSVSLFDLVAKDDVEALKAALVPTADKAANRRALPLEVRLASAEGPVCTLYVNRTEGSDGSLAGFVVHFIDSTEQKNLERQFAQSQKMQAVGQLAGGIAHDFNNLLTAMIGFSDLLLLRHRPGDQSFADIMQIKQNANRAANLVRQLLAFSRQQTLQPRLLNLTDILAELSHLLRRLIGENIELKMSHGRDLGMIKADQGQLEQVIINLAVNARDAMDGGGVLNIRTAGVKVERARKLKDETMPPGNYTVVEVTDTGCGIPVENLDRIFDPFFSTKEVGAGTGLGLSTVYGIVKQTGGYVFVESTLGEGTTFSIFLPAVAEQEVAATIQEAEAQDRRDLTGAGTLLLVEDEDAVRAFSARALRNKGYIVLEANSGETALEILSKQQDPIDLLVTDVVMPRLDGPSLVKEVRQTRPDLKVIFISGYAEDSFRKRLDEDTGIHFLPKPFSLKQLAGKVKEVLGE